MKYLVVVLALCMFFAGYRADSDDSSDSDSSDDAPAPTDPPTTTPCSCPFIYDPVCGEIGVVKNWYDNSCVMNCEGASLVPSELCDPTTPGNSLPFGKK